MKEGGVVVLAMILVFTKCLWATKPKRRRWWRVESGGVGWSRVESGGVGYGTEAAAGRGGTSAAARNQTQHNKKTYSLIIL